MEPLGNRLTGMMVILGMLLAGCADRHVSKSAPPRTTDASATEKTNGYILLADGSIHFDSERPPSGLFVRGKVPLTRKVKPDSIEPVGDVQGEGPLGQEGSPGWMELSNGTFFGAQTARSPFKPYINGYKDTNEKFMPSSRTVVY